MPIKVASKPKTTLAATYEKNKTNFCSLSNPMPSTVKAEKVVKPPQNPVIKNNFHPIAIGFSLLSNDLKLRPQKIPINKQPIIFTANVPHGKEGA